MTNSLPYLSRVVAAMVKLQLLTGARPGEICAMRPCDVSFGTTGVWTLRPATHKTQHHGKDRRIFIGPEGQAVLRPFLDGSADAYCFSPAESEAERRAELNRHRKTPRHLGNSPGSNRSNEPRRPARERYDKNYYARAVIRACELAFGMPKELRKLAANLPAAERERLQQQASEWRAAHCWSPNQLRHSRATILRERYGIEAAQVVLGHSDPRVTEIYAERDFSMAARIMAEIG